jgi:fructose-1-phosphate kinase PfkB-like protein
MLSEINMESEIINLNVGGTHHLQTDRMTLCSVPGSRLEKWFKGVVELKKDENNEVFLDRDGQTFLHVLNYLRNKRELYPDFMDHNDEIQFFKELEHWEIPTMQGFK